MDDDQLAADIARQAGELLLDLQARDATKDEGDRLSNDLILERLAAARPDDAVLSEESKDSPARLSQERVWIVSAFTASLGVLGLCEASFWTVAVNLGKQRGGTSAAIMNTGGNGIGLLAPMVTPWLGSHLGWQWGLGTGAVVGIAGGLCWFGIKAQESAKA